MSVVLDTTGLGIAEEIGVDLPEDFCTYTRERRRAWTAAEIETIAVQMLGDSLRKEARQDAEQRAQEAATASWLRAERVAMRRQDQCMEDHYRAVEGILRDELERAGDRWQGHNEGIVTTK